MMNNDELLGLNAREGRRRTALGRTAGRRRQPQRWSRGAKNGKEETLCAALRRSHAVHSQSHQSHNEQTQPRRTPMAQGAGNCITRPHLSNDPMALVATNPGHTHLLGLIVVDRIRTLISHSSSQGVYAVITCLVAAASRRRTGARLPMRVAPQPRAKPRPPLPPYVRGSYSLDQTTPRPTVGQRRLCPLRWPLVVGPPAPPPPLAFCCPAIAISAPRSALRPPPPSSLPWPGDPRTRHL